jgi:predicted amidohydrolase YtcJ
VIKKTAILLLLFLCAACEPEVTTENVAVTAETSSGPEVILIHNAQIYTMDRGFSTADSMVFDGNGEVRFVGNVEPMREMFPDARQIDLQGKTIIPGLIDAHGHLAGLAVSLAQAQLQGTTSKQEVMRKLREHEKSLADGDWLLGRGWDQNDWPVQAFPSRADLDKEFPDRPVWLRRIDGHAAWGNSAALAMADQDLSGDWQPQGGHIYRQEDGQASGVLIDGAMTMVDQAVPEMSRELMQASLDLALQQMVSLGLTGVHDAGTNLEVLSWYQERIRQDRFPTRVYTMTDGAGATLDWLCENGAVIDESGQLYMHSVKLYIDGALGSRGAALLADYSDDPENTGLLFMPSEDLQAMVDKAMACGFQVAIHGIGDRGNQVALDALAASIPKHPGNPGRHRIEHSQVLTEADISRFASLDVIASMQPTHATSDMYWAEERLGSERIQYAYAWRSLLDAGARLALGSDFPVEQVNPMLGIHSAVTRQDSKNWPEGGWYPKQNLTREEAVRGFTMDAAYAGFMENTVGSLEQGKRADFIVLDRNIMEVDAAEIPSIKVLQTWLDGELVWER